jgi:hypothetical protein
VGSVQVAQNRTWFEIANLGCSDFLVASDGSIGRLLMEMLRNEDRLARVGNHSERSGEVI